MKCRLLVLSLSFVLVLSVPTAQAKGRHHSREHDGNRGKRKQDRPGHDKSREGARPLKIRLVPGPNVPWEHSERKENESYSSRSYRNLQEQQSTYSVIPVSNDPSEAGPQLTQEEIQKILWREEKEHHEEEERLRRKDEARRKRRKERKEQEEKQRKLVEQKRKEEEEALRLQLQKEEEEYRRHTEEMESKRKREEEMRIKEEHERREMEREEREKERKLEEERIKQQEVKETEEVWLRGDVFQMSPKQPLSLPTPIPKPPIQEDEFSKGRPLRDEEDEEEDNEQDEAKLVQNRAGLPPGCDISDVSVTCEDAKLRYFPPLSIPELKSLSLAGNSISDIPTQAFNGIPNLEWINLSKNQLTSSGIDAQAFKSLKMLKRLYLDGNLLEKVPPDLPPTLQELKLNENKLKGVDETSFQDMSNLMILEMEGNLLSEGNVDPQAFNPLTQLHYLRLGRNHFRIVPQGLPHTLLELYLENNLIEEISETAFNRTTSINVISLRNNKLDETKIAPMAWIHLRNLESIDLSNNEFYLVPSFLPTTLVHLVLVGNNIERIPGYVFAHMNPGLEYLYLSYNKLDGEGTEPESFFGTYHSMVEVCLDHNQLVSVPGGISEMTTLHFLRLDNNKIRDIPDNSICDPEQNGDVTLVALRLENNYIKPNKISATAFSCVRAASSVVLKPQRVK